MLTYSRGWHTVAHQPNLASWLHYWHRVMHIHLCFLRLHCRVEQLEQRPYSLQSWKSLRTDPSQEKFADPRPRKTEIKWHLDIIFLLSDCWKFISLKTLLQNLLILIKSKLIKLFKWQFGNIYLFLNFIYFS